MALFPQNPVAVVMQAAIPMDRDLVARGVAQHQLDGFGKVLVVAVDPLPVVAALGDGVKLLRPVVPLVSHGLLMASWGPLPVFLHLRAAASFLVSF